MLSQFDTDIRRADPASSTACNSCGSISLINWLAPEKLMSMRTSAMPGASIARVDATASAMTMPAPDASVRIVRRSG